MSPIGRVAPQLLAAMALAALPLAACSDPPEGHSDDRDVAAAADLRDAAADLPEGDPDASVSDPPEGNPDALDAGTDAGEDPSIDGNADDAGRPQPVAAIIAPRYAQVGQEVELSARNSVSAFSHEWDLGDGRVIPAGERPRTTLVTRWDVPGRYQVRLTVRDLDSVADTASALVTVMPARTFVPRRSGSIAVLAATDTRGAQIAAVSPDSGELSVFSAPDISEVADDEPVSDPVGEFGLVYRIDTCPEPRGVAQWGERLAVTCPATDQVRVHEIADGALVYDVPLPWGSRPFGVVGDDLGRLLITLQGRGALALVEDLGGEPVTTGWISVGPDPRGVALLPGDEALVTRWRSPDEQGELTRVDASEASAPVQIPLRFDPVPSSDTETGGVPTYLDAIAVAPSGTLAVVPSLQANIGRGESLDGEALTHETTLRAALSYVDFAAGEENFEARKLFDDRGLPAGAAFSPHGDYIYVAMRGSRALERIDLFTLSQSGSQQNVGFAPSDVAVLGRWVIVDAYLSRELVVYDGLRFSDPAPFAQLSLVTEEPLDDALLLGKRLFNDSLDIRIAKDSYIACAHCHLDGEADRRTWDFTDRGEGIRNTTSLLGRAGTAHGPVHWSANFDEIQDFEHDLRGPFRGLGLMDDADFTSGDRDRPLGAPKAGFSDDLDALATYVASLDAFPRSPARLDSGELTEGALRGEALFEALECASCHAGDAMTDSGFVAPGQPRLHDVGTLTPASGQRLGEELPGIDTPTLRGVWNTGPYLHDGSAASLAAVIRLPGDAHGVTSGLSDQDIEDLEEFLLSLE